MEMDNGYITVREDFRVYNIFGGMDLGMIILLSHDMQVVEVGYPRKGDIELTM